MLRTILDAPMGEMLSGQITNDTAFVVSGSYYLKISSVYDYICDKMSSTGIVSTETDISQSWSQISQTYTLDPSSSASPRSYYGHKVTVQSQTGNTETFGGIYGINSTVTLKAGATTSALDALLGFSTNYGTATAIKAGWIGASNIGNVSGGFAYGLQATLDNASHSLGTGTLATGRALRVRVQNVVQNAGGASGDAAMTTCHLVYTNLINDVDQAGSYAATIGTAVGFQYDITNSANAVITNSYGIKLTTPSNAGTITNHYGIYLEDQTVSGTTLNYSIYSAGGKNYFGGNVGIGTSSFGTSGTQVLALAKGTAPSSSPGDVAQIYCDDQTAGNSCFHTRTENGKIIKLYQQAHIANATDASNVITRCNDILLALENLGLLATS